MPVVVLKRKAIYVVLFFFGVFLTISLRYVWSGESLGAIDILQQEGDKPSNTSKQTMVIGSSEKHHVVYIRIPKTGSSTVTAMIWQFAWRRNLSVLTTHPHWTGTRATICKPFFYMPPENVKMDMMAEHVMYRLWTYDRYFHKDTVYVTMLREPMAMLASTLYYVPEFENLVPGPNKVQSYLKNPRKYDGIAIEDVSRANRSFTRNPQTRYFGLLERFFNHTVTVNRFISFTAADMELVMILERLDESLVLLKRTLGWSMLDVVPAEQSFNTNHKKPRIIVTAEDRRKYREWSQADHLMYEFFYKKLNETVERLGPDFQNEVRIFRKVRKDVSRFCRLDAISGDSLEVPGSPYNEPFQVTTYDCFLHKTEPLVLIGMIRKRQGYFPYLHRLLESAEN